MNVKAMYKLSYGIYVVTSKKDSLYNGQIANTLFQVTSEPLTVAVSINRNNLTHEYIEESRVFAASVVAQDTPLAFIGRFGFKSGREGDKFEGVNYKTGETGAPIVLDNAVAYLEARVTGELEVSTHTVFVGEVVGAEVVDEQKEVMTYAYYHKIKGGQTPRAAATYIEEKPSPGKPGLTKYRCTVCGYIYDPEVGDPDGGIKPGTPFEDIPEDWVCPVCGAAKSEFEKVD